MIKIKYGLVEGLKFSFNKISCFYNLSLKYKILIKNYIRMFTQLRFVNEKERYT